LVESKQWSLLAQENTKRSLCSGESTTIQEQKDVFNQIHKDMLQARKDGKKIKRTIDYIEHNTHIRFNLDFYSTGEDEDTGDDCTITIKCGEEGLNSDYNITVCFDTGIDYLNSKKISLYDIFDKFCSYMEYCGFCIYSPTHTELTISELKDFARSFITHLEFWEGGYVEYDERHIPECLRCKNKRIEKGNFKTPRVENSQDYEETYHDIRDDYFIGRSIRQDYQDHKEGCIIQ